MSLDREERERIAGDLSPQVMVRHEIECSSCTKKSHVYASSAFSAAEEFAKEGWRRNGSLLGVLCPRHARLRGLR